MITPAGVGCNAWLDAELPQRYDGAMKVQFTAVFRPVKAGYVAFVEELPGANTQGATLEEARANLEEAVALVLEANRTLARQDSAGEGVIREPLRLTA
jgi:predicted RNase H-like HicB family nuclease